MKLIRITRTEDFYLPGYSSKKMKCHLFKSARNGQWYFHFVARNGKVVCASEGYHRKTAARKTIQAITSMGDIVPVVLEGVR